MVTYYESIYQQYDACSFTLGETLCIILTLKRTSNLFPLHNANDNSELATYS